MFSTAKAGGFSGAENFCGDNKKKKFEIDEEIIVQKSDHESEEYVDKNSMTEVEDCSKLGVILDGECAFF